MWDIVFASFCGIRGEVICTFALLGYYRRQCAMLYRGNPRRLQRELCKWRTKYEPQLYSATKSMIVISAELVIQYTVYVKTPYRCC
jgi:hypothetical protein